MSTVTVGAPRRYTDRGWPAISAPIDVDGRRFDIYFRSERGPLADDASPFVLAALVPAMKLGSRLRVESPVSPSLRALLEEMQGAISYWFRAFKRAVLDAPLPDAGEPAPAASGRGVALFFSGGVDSFYSLLKHNDEITDLMYVHGFDTLLANTEARAANARALRQAAAETGKQLFEIETNLRVLDRVERWSHHTSTTAQLAIMLALKRQFTTVYIADNYSYSNERPIDQLPYVMSADGANAVFDGIDAMRLDKIRYIASSPVVMRWLRVCWQNLGVTYNCGRCEKCLRTMIGLELAGALGRCRTFNRPIDIERVRCIDVNKFARFWPEILLALDQSGDHPELAQAVRDSVRSSSTASFRWERMLVHLAQRGDKPEMEAIVREFLAYSQAPAEQREQANKLREARARIIALEDELAAIKGSRSWKLVAPLRALGRRYRSTRLRIGG